MKWDKLPSALQGVLLNDNYSYVVENYQEIDDTTGDSPHFFTTVRVNLDMLGTL